jgi:signal transduction histidine kinase/chemotaxis response regulator CheB
VPHRRMIEVMTESVLTAKAARTVDIIAMVASAGSLDALTAVLRGLPTDLPVPVVAQVHMGGQGSVLAGILQRRTGHEIDWAENRLPLEPGRVLIARPRRTLEILPDGTCSVADEATTALDLPHDTFLRSVADSYGSRAIAVVLSGMGRDGAVGVTALHTAGALVLAQSEETAEHPSMPKAAAEAGADLVLPLHEIGHVLAGVLHGEPLPRAEEEAAAIDSTFGAAGVIAGLARTVDWAATPLGAVHTWPAARRIAVRMSMDSAHGVAVYFGAEHIQLFNEATLPSLGGREAEVFARPYADSYPGLVDYMVPVLATVQRGEHVRHPATLVPFERNGRIEDAWFDMSYVPIRDVDGEVIGVQQSFLERTDEVLGARRLEIINRLATVPAAVDRRRAVEAALTVLDDSDDVLFAVAYAVNGRVPHADLMGAVGIPPGVGLAPDTLPLTASAAWPIRSVVDGEQPVLIDDLASRFRGQVLGPRRLAPEAALLHPLRNEADGAVVGVLVLGLTPARPVDTGFRDFLTVVCETIGAKVNESDARRRERQRIEQLAALDRAKTEFFANVSHEFRTPLTLMLAPLEQLLQHPDDAVDVRRQQVEIVHRNTRRLLRLVGTLLDFSQAEAGRLRPQLAATDLSTLTADIAAMFRSAVQAAGLDFVVDTPALPQPVVVDPEMWEKVVANLLSNSLKFTWQGGITVSLEALHRHVQLTVQDTGIGIPAEELPHVTKRFHRVRPSAARTYEGAGIGLALVDELVRRHRGRLRVASDEGRGTTVTVWIPLDTVPPAGGADGATPGLVASAMAEEAERWAAAPAAPLPDSLGDEPGEERIRPAGADARVLVVDDNADMRDYLRRLLAQDFDVATAFDGADALAQIQARRPDLVLADVMMPQLNGFELLRAVRGDPALAATPVVLITARAGEVAAIDGLLAGADDYIVKPFSARELLARATAQIELARLRRANERRFRALIESSFDAVYRMSPDWSEMRALDGRGFIVDTEEPSTSWLDVYIDPADQPRVLEAIGLAIAGHNNFELEHRVRRPDGSLGWTLSRAVPLLDDAGEIVEWVGTATDVTARRAPSG